MKKGFTMIELIFVIVILGILAATAIPKLNATRDDARMVTAAQEADRIFSELGGYYTAQGAFADGFDNGSTNVNAMTNVSNPIRLGNHDCLTVAAGAQTGNNARPGQVVITIGTDGLCANLWETAAMQQLSKTFYNDIEMNASYPSIHTTTNGYKFSPAKGQNTTAYTTFGTNKGINFQN